MDPDGAGWYGSLVWAQQDQTGRQYKRNRYYDVTAGQFTQEDPIGLAGGLNLYGYANGDPVNFSDPFGLCPNPPCLRPRPGMFMGAALNAVGQGAEHPASQAVLGIALSTFAPEATAAGGAYRLYRIAKGAESLRRLAGQAAEAEAAGWPHGISLTGNRAKFGTPEHAGPGATLDEISQHFRVHVTPTRADPTHHTLEVPKPLTQSQVDLINRLFRQ